MRNSLSLNMDNNLEESLDRYVFMHDFLKPAEKITHQLSRDEKKLKKFSTKFKQNYGKLKKTLETKSEMRIDNKDFKKELKKNIKDTKKALKIITSLDQETDKFYIPINDLFEQSLEVLEKCNPNCSDKQLKTVINTIDFNEALIKELEPSFIKKKYSQNMSLRSDRLVVTLVAQWLSVNRPSGGPNFDEKTGPWENLELWPAAQATTYWISTLV